MTSRGTQKARIGQPCANSVDQPQYKWHRAVACVARTTMPIVLQCAQAIDQTIRTRCDALPEVSDHNDDHSCGQRCACMSRCQSACANALHRQLGGWCMQHIHACRQRQVRAWPHVCRPALQLEHGQVALRAVHNRVKCWASSISSSTQLSRHARACKQIEIFNLSRISTVHSLVQ